MSLVNLAQVKGTETLKNDVQKMLKSYDALKQTCEANKAYVDKKIADLVNGAPEQLDTLQELSKALNNDKDYAATVNNALAEKLGRTEKAVSAETADSANTLEGVPLSHGGDSTFGKIPVVGDDGVLEIGKYIDFHSKNGDKKDYSTRIEANDDGTLSFSGGIGVGGTVINKITDDSYLQIMSGTTYDKGAHLNLSANNNTMYGSGSFSLVAALEGKSQKALVGKLNGALIWNSTDLTGACIVSQQLGQDVSYIKYANGLLVQKIRSSIAQGVNITGGCKVHLTLPVAFKDRSYAAYITVDKAVLGSSDGPFICYFSPVGASKVDIIITNGRNSTDFYDIYVVCIGIWK